VICCKGRKNSRKYQRIRDAASLSGAILPTGHELSPGEISALMTECENDPSPAGARDAAIIALLYSCGLRRKEAASLELSNYDPNNIQDTHREV
jgi:integrase